jgi:hypothetical protein
VESGRRHLARTKLFFTSGRYSSRRTVATVLTECQLGKSVAGVATLTTNIVSLIRVVDPGAHFVSHDEPFLLTLNSKNKRSQGVKFLGRHDERRTVFGTVTWTAEPEFNSTRFVVHDEDIEIDASSVGAYRPYFNACAQRHGGFSAWFTAHWSKSFSARSMPKRFRWMPTADNGRISRSRMSGGDERMAGR